MAGSQDAGRLGEALIDFLERSGCERVETPVLQPAELFVDLSGEDIRRRMYVTGDGQGREFYLRPDFTVPICSRHLASGRGPARYCYLGPVFRQSESGPGEVLQAGVELIGEAAVAAADAEAIGLALDGAMLVRPGRYAVRLGDVGLLGAILTALELPGPACRRIVRLLAAGQVDAALAPGTPDAAPVAYSGLLAAIEGQDPRAARAFVEDVISIAGISRVGGRSAGEIAERFLQRAENRSGSLPERARAVLGRYVAIRGDLDEAADEIRTLAREERLDLSSALERFEDRTGFIAARGIDLADVHFAADFARPFDYYTGAVFEIREAGRAEVPFLAAGGRYDRLFQEIGGAAAVPAIGCSFWPARFGDGDSA